MKTKSAATEVTAPKNADSNCRQTKTNEYGYNSSHKLGESTLLPSIHKTCVKNEKGYKTPYKK